MASRIDIIKRAASQTGNGPLNSIDDNEDVARLADESYEPAVTAALTAHGWNFARQAFELTALAAVPELPWIALWQRPAGLLSTAYLVDVNGVRVVYEERDTDDGAAFAVRVDLDDLFAIGVGRADESRWPADFEMAIEHRMRAAFHRGIAFQLTAAEKDDNRAEALLQRARVRDKRASTSPDPTPWDLTLSRRRTSAGLSAR